MKKVLLFVLMASIILGLGACRPKEELLPDAPKTQTPATAPQNEQALDCVSLPSALPEQMPSDFNFEFRIGVGANNRLDSYRNEIEKDMVIDENIIVKYEVSDEIKAQVYEKILEYKIMEIDVEMISENLRDENESGGTMSPCSTMSIRFTANGKEYFVKGNSTAGFHKNSNPKAKRYCNFMEYMGTILFTLPEYKALPEPRAGYC